MILKRMPFGKHEGELLSDLPARYLAWLLSLDLYEPLKTSIVLEARRRGLIEDDEKDSRRPEGLRLLTKRGAA